MRRNATTDPGVHGSEKQPYEVWESNASRTCADCGRKLSDDNVLTFFKDDKALCLKCAGLSPLVFLPSGDAALTRRATAHSSQYAVVLRRNPSRRRTDRLGILVEPAALDRAKDECSGDAEVRKQKRASDAERRKRQNQEHVERFRDEILKLYPGCPGDDAAKIAAHACEEHSGRVGRSAAAKKLDASAIRNAVIAHIRHTHTKYNELLGIGVSRELAREQVQSDIDDFLSGWQSVIE